MPTNEKELNVFLLAHLDTIEDALEVAQEEQAANTIKYLEKRKKQIERMLYQNPPIS